LSASQLNPSSFEELVQSSFSDSVSDILGKETWKAISFYFDISLLANEPEIFASVLERLLGKTAKVLEKAITETLFARVGATIEKREGYSFQTLIRIAKAKFLASVSGLNRNPGLGYPTKR
jgi:hypothetical protein